MSNLMVNRVKRRVSCLPKATYYKPRKASLCDLEIINLSIGELEAIRLCDLIHIDQNEAADTMGISRKTFWSDLQKAPDQIPSPAWHSDVLQARERRVREGESSFGDWAEAKRRIREQTQ